MLSTLCFSDGLQSGQVVLLNGCDIESNIAAIA